MAGPIEQKAYAGPVTTLVAGYLAALLIETVPWLRDQLTPDQKLNLPIIIAFALSALAGYLVPHTHRPDLAPDTAAELRVSIPKIEPRHAAPGTSTTGDTNIGT